MINYFMQAEYTKAIELVKELCKRGDIDGAAKKEMLKAMDYGIQIVLYAMALHNDGCVDFKEREIIQNIVQYGDVFADSIAIIPIYSLHTNLSWDLIELPMFSCEKHMEFLNIILETVQPMIKTFIEIATIIDSERGTLSSDSTIYKIEEKIIHIASQMALSAWDIENNKDIGESVTFSTILVFKIFSSVRREAENKYRN